MVEAPCGEEVEAETMDEDDQEEEGHKEDDEDVDDEDGGEGSKSHSSSESTQKSPCSTHHYSDRCHHHHCWAKQSESGNGKDGSFGEIPVSEDSEDEGGEAGCLQAPPTSPLYELESSGKSPDVVGQAVPGETMSTVGDLLPAGSQDAVVVHATEDEMRSLE